MRTRVLIFAISFLMAGRFSLAQSAWHTIHNDFYWVDQNGERIMTRSGCLTKFDGLYYWYGGSQANRFREQYCYTSPDLVHWTNHGAVLRHDVEANRIDVVYNPNTKQYVMVMKYDGNGAHLGIAAAEKPDGPFTFKSQTLVDNALMGDSSVYINDDGKAYLCYVSWAVGTNAQHGIYLMSPDYLSLDKRIYLWDIRSREAPHIFKRNGIYYYGTSRTAGIESSGTNYYTAGNIAGSWSPPVPLSTPGSTNSWDSQVDMIIPLKGTDETTYFYFGDRWIKNTQQGRNGDYIFLPMEFDGDKPILNYYHDWDINLAAGTWRKFDPSRNLAAGKAVTASSETEPNVAKNVTASKTYKDYVNTYWQSGDGNTQWIMVDLEKPTEINRVILKWNTNAARTFKIQTSSDASNWTDVFSTNLGSSYTVTDETFKTTTARYVRMYATELAPAPRGMGFGRRGMTSTAPAPTGYSLFDFMVLRD
ncbi:MAG: discoidin domain-containing protein [Sedimentisphaerales bacterium]|nr:discoidin domain-containing protein [Sedimentisphaerales bacterium]